MDSEKAQENLRDVKHRPLTKAFPVMCADENQIKEIAYVDDRAEKLIRAFMPGPVTFILKKKEEVPAYVNGGMETLAIRMATSDALRELIKAAGAPVFMTSANQSGEPVCTSLDEIEKSCPTLDGMLINEAKFKKNIAVGVTLPYEAREDAEIQKILAKYRKNMIIVNAIMRQERKCRVNTMIQVDRVNLDQYRALSEDDRSALLRMVIEPEERGNSDALLEKESSSISLLHSKEIDHILMTQDDFEIPVHAGNSQGNAGRCLQLAAGRRNSLYRRCRHLFAETGSAEPSGLRQSWATGAPWPPGNR